MKAWVDKVAGIAGESCLWNSGSQFGDWLDPTAPQDRPQDAQADEYVVATAHFARSSRLLAHAAALVGRADDAGHYAALADRVVAAFNREYVTPAGRVLSDCQTVYALALCWDLLDSESKRQHAGARLAELVRDAHFHVSTGFVGTPLILDALCRAGHSGLAYRMLLEVGCPSWLYAVTMGATTMWERWDSMLPDGSINPGSMTSFNHYAYGAVADWMHRVIAGIAAAEPGYRRVTIRPVPGGDLTSASARHRSPYGDVSTAWTVVEGRFRLEVELPYGVDADVWLPGDIEARTVAFGRHVFSAVLTT